MIIPVFPACLAPQGEIVSSYSAGVHGIVGSPYEYKGSDVVYKIDEDTLAQCFCAEDGSGIQTNWWKADGLTDDEIEVQKSLGWILIPNGQVWGLENSRYLAKNITYSCRGGGSTGGGSSSGSNDSNSSGGVGGWLEQVLGLASTGDNLRPMILGTIGVSLLLLGFSVRKAK